MNKSIKITSISELKKGFRLLFDLFANYVKNNDINHYLSLKKIVKIRSVNQNRLYWWWIGFISIETGETSENLHKTFKEMFLPVETLQVLNFKLIKNISTTDLSTTEFNAFLEEIRIYMLEFDSTINLLYPDDENFTEFVEFIQTKGQLQKL